MTPRFKEEAFDLVVILAKAFEKTAEQHPEARERQAILLIANALYRAARDIKLATAADTVCRRLDILEERPTPPLK